MGASAAEERAAEEQAAEQQSVRKRTRRRSIAIWALIVLASLIGLISVLTVWVDRQMFDDDAWNDASTEIIEDPAVQQSLSVYLVNQLYDNVDVAAALEERLPTNVQPLAAPLSAALRQPAANGVEFLLARPRVQQLWINAMALAHEKLVNVLENETGFGISTGSGVVTLDLSELVSELGIELGLPEAALERLPPDAGVITLLESDQLSAAQTGVRAIHVASAWLAVLVLGMFALAVYLGRGTRRETLRNIGWAFVFVGMLVLVVRRLGGNYVIGSLTDETWEPSGRRVWAIGTEILRESGRSAIFYGLVVILAAVLAGPMGLAVATRRRLAPVMRNHPEYVWGTVAVAYLLLVLWAPTYALQRPIWILIFGLLLVLGLFVLRRQTLAEFPDEPRPSPITAGLRDRLRPGGAEARPSAADEIAKLEQLRAAGAIDEAEFIRAKQLALG
jgi:hypothetical protein